MPEQAKQRDAEHMRRFVQEALLSGVDVPGLHEVYNQIRYLFNDKYSDKTIDGIISWKYTPDDKLVLEKDREAVESRNTTLPRARF